jgi:hypothetical protein
MSRLEGSGRIELRYAYVKEHDCSVGYATPGSRQSITYRVTEKGCTVFNHFIS